ncbi:hypothetical protein DEFDS_0118 [Deferribacter desulfuricans SSM1]|uniref:DUF4845 domain-containing protein n=1 Tax=Deferribacter desulfuricans (strain DSM 14783 / JCM 11476 / NBRC 101012 / SSM1) TaxID=639282 RepID=D3PAK7_DEFDS|nr:hypothetical protein [Deferribacter desulfuricans]BAI79630.1 hypothetical protein DEFDS_0118 [Deferribacter desulfuricans SSM1]
MFRLIIKLAIFFILIYVGVLFAKPWVKYYIFKNAFENVIYNEKRFPDYNIVRNLMDEATDLNIPIKKSDIKIINDDYKKVYKIEYKEIVKLPFVKKEFVFNYVLKAEKELEGEGG